MAEPARRRRAGGIRLRTTAAAVAVVGIALVTAAFGTIAFGRRSSGPAGDEAVLRAGQIADAGVPDGTAIEVPDAEEEFVQVLDGTHVARRAPTSLGTSLGSRHPAPARGDDRTVRAPFAPGPFLAASASMDAPDGARTVVVGVNIDDVVEARNAVTIAMLIGVPLLLVVVGLVTWWIVGRTLRPVDDIRAQAERISGAICTGGSRCPRDVTRSLVSPAR